MKIGSAIVVLALACGSLFGQAGPSIKPVRITQPLKIDGLLDEDPIWRTAARITDFVQRRPLDGAPASEKTELLVAYDSDNIYFGVYAHYSDPTLIRANRVDRDQIWNDDRISVIFDPFLDQQRAYRFAVNGYGVQGDALMSGAGTGDVSWNVLFSSAGMLVEDGWTVEIAIPFKSLRYPSRSAGEAHHWALQIERDIASKNENAVWSPISRDLITELGQMGRMEGMTNLSTSHNLELLPTFTALHVGKRNASGQFEYDNIEEAGINLKYGITSNLTFDFTYNPDFSQIESDTQQIEVNQRFPVLYPELRPFFLEGQEIFRIPGPVTFIHTRTIVDPQFGAKLSGKAGKTTLGLLVANDEAPGKVDSQDDPAFGKTAKVVVGRARYDLYRESTASFIFTDREFMKQSSRAIGVDGDVALGRTNRFFMRYINTNHLDAVGVRRTGYFYDANFRHAARHLNFSLITNAISPDLRTDAGFVRRTDQRQSLVNLSYRLWPENWIVNWTPRMSHSRNYQFDGTLQEQQNSAGVAFAFDKNITADVGVNRDMERYRGNDFWKTRYAIKGTIATSRRVSASIDFNGGDQIRFVTNPYLGSTTAWDVTLTAKPVSRLQSDFRLTTSRFIDTRTDHEEFDVRILRLLTTYQFTNRLQVRNILDRNTFDKTYGLNLLFTYRVNAGTVFYVGYDDRHRQGDLTSRAVFMKFQYLLRHRS